MQTMMSLLFVELTPEGRGGDRTGGDKRGEEGRGGLDGGNVEDEKSVSP
jgi:hypothetical protein